MRPFPIVAFTIFLGSFLLFAVQPMMGRMLLPAFGGSAAVWSVCLAAYQILLLAGYGYAHGLSKWPVARQRRLHAALLAAAVFWVAAVLLMRDRIMPRIGSSPFPIAEVLVCVLLGVGLPYVLLASGSSLLQAWMTRGSADRRVYRLYAISNFGSLLGLFSYPLAVEPVVPLRWQWTGWALGLLAYTLLVAIVARGLKAEAGDPKSEVGSRKSGGAAPESGSGNQEPPTAPGSAFPSALSRPWVWFALPACSAYLLVAMTNHLSLDVEPVPLMWVFLLGAFLLSYIVGFSEWAQRALPMWLCLAAAALGLQAWHGIAVARGGSFLGEMLRGGAMLFLAGAFLHSWLYRVRPHTDRLTFFYLGIAVGGAVGGTAASLASPVLFRQVLEYPIALVFTAALVAWFVWRLDHRELRGLNETMLVICCAVPVVLGWQLAGQGRDVILHTRNFYGALRVTEASLKVGFDQSCRQHTLMNGETVHGLQCLLPAFAHLGTTYYGPLGGGRAVLQHPAFTNRALRVGCIGLGAGTLSVYGRPRDTYRFFEINPQVVAVAENTNLFTYLSDCPAQVQVAAGDARKTLTAEAARGEPLYDVLIVDAYSGDAIPIHLATREAFQLYLRRLAPDGILAVHISNWHIDLLPLCKAVARDLNLHLLGLVSEAQPTRLAWVAQWVLMSRDALPLAGQATPLLRQVDWTRVRDMRTPTDETGSLLELVRFVSRPPLEDVAIRPQDIEALFR